MYYIIKFVDYRIRRVYKFLRGRMYFIYEVNGGGMGIVSIVIVGW